MDTFSWQGQNNLLWISFGAFNFILFSYIAGVKKVGDHWSKKCYVPLLGQLKIISSSSVNCQLKSSYKEIIVKQKIFIWNTDNTVYIKHVSKNLVSLALLTDLECKSLKLVQIKFSKCLLKNYFKIPTKDKIYHTLYDFPNLATHLWFQNA